MVKLELLLLDYNSVSTCCSKDILTAFTSPPNLIVRGWVHFGRIDFSCFFNTGRLSTFVLRMSIIMSF